MAKMKATQVSLLLSCALITAIPVAASGRNGRSHREETAAHIFLLLLTHSLAGIKDLAQLKAWVGISPHLPLLLRTISSSD
jgi:hypothetical protein